MLHLSLYSVDYLLVDQGIDSLITVLRVVWRWLGELLSTSHNDINKLTQLIDLQLVIK